MKMIKGRSGNRFSSSYSSCILIIIFLYCKPSFAQSFSIQPGIGLGSTLAKKENANKKGRMMINLNGYFNVDNRLSVGIEFASAGSFINTIGGSISQDKFDPATNTITKDASNMKSSTVLAKVKYYFTDKKKGIAPFAEFGLGANTYYENVFNIPASNTKKIKRSNLAYQPEIGFSVRHFQLSIRYLVGGKTPDFKGVDDSGANVRYESIRISPLYLNAGWRFDF